MEAHEYALTVLDAISREIRNTGYFPTTACDSTGGLTAASSTSVNIQYDKNGNGNCSGDDEVVTFAFGSSNVTRNGQALSDSNISGLQFLYYPQQTSSTAPAPYCVATGLPSGCSGSLSSSLASVKRIVISLTVQPRSTDAQFTGSGLSMSTTVDLRNRTL
jgi:hypothetical protein